MERSVFYEPLSCRYFMCEDETYLKAVDELLCYLSVGLVDYVDLANICGITVPIGYENVSFLLENGIDVLEDGTRTPKILMDTVGYM